MGKTRSNSAMVYADRVLFAAKSGDLLLLRRYGKLLLKNRSGAKLASYDEKGNSAIHYAALHGDVQMCKYILNNLFVDVDFRSSTGKTPLCFAAHSGDMNTIRYLISQGADVNAQDKYRVTPLHYAILGEKDKVVKLLLMRGARVEASSSVGTPLMFATFQGNAPCMKALIRHGSAVIKKIVYRDVSCLTIAIMRSQWFGVFGWNRDIVYTLIEARAKVNDRPILGLASYSLTLVKYLLSHGAEPLVVDMFGRLPEEVAATKNRRDVVKALLAQRVSGRTPLAEAVQRTFDRVNDNVYRLECKRALRVQLRQLMPRIELARSRQDYLAALTLATHAYLQDHLDDNTILGQIMQDCFVRMDAIVEPLLL